MKRASWALIAVVVAAILEVVVLSAVGRAIGVLPLFAVLAVEAAIGGFLLKREGSKAWQSLRAAERDPARMGPAMSDAALVLVGALLLMLPGFISDALGILFLVPATRGVARSGITGVFRALTRKYRDQADLMVAKTQPTSVIRGETVEAGEPTWSPDPRRRPDDGVVRGEIVP